MLKISRSQILFVGLALIVAFSLTYGIVQRPAYTDAYYHFNAANRLVRDEGLVDDYLWVYIGAPAQLPAPSHLYWMPLTSIIASLGMRLFNAPGDYASAQFFFALMVFGVGLLAYRLAFLLGGRLRHAWIAGILSLLGGFFALRWGTIDTFAPYAFIGSLALLFIGMGASAKHRNTFYWVLAGIFAGLGHLTRVDGLLLLLTAWAVIGFPFDFLRSSEKFSHLLRQRLMAFILVTLCYLLTMTPWFIRNINQIGSILPVGGTQSIWFTEYNDLFSYPPDASPDTLLADGLDLFLAGRWTALVTNLGTLVAVEGMVILFPLMFIALWKRRQNLILRGFWIFVLGIHLAMTIVFPFPGYRGGLLHAVSALVPFWMVLGILGLDDVIDWIAKRRHTWNANTAKPIFSAMILVFGVMISLAIALPNQVKVSDGLPRIYAGIQELVPTTARIMINDPAQLYYFLGLGGVVLPNESIDTVPVIAQQYDIDYLVLESVQDDGLIRAAPKALQFDVDNPPDFLEPIPFTYRKDVRLYAIVTD